mmetsp:Transcript_10578/g.18810  ORF Transcript_10578/g.18810 Transcript_10578/m.18810 type:complete len:84 (-) Transcript_10578:319-570(-)
MLNKYPLVVALLRRKKRKRKKFAFLIKQCTTHAGTLLGQKDLKFLCNMYDIFFFTVPAYVLRLKVRALTGVQAVDIGTMWAAF